MKQTTIKHSHQIFQLRNYSPVAEIPFKNICLKEQRHLIKPANCQNRRRNEKNRERLRFKTDNLSPDSKTNPIVNCHPAED